MSKWTVQHQYTVYSIYTLFILQYLNFLYGTKKSNWSEFRGLKLFLLKKLTTFFSSNMCTLLKRNCKSKNNYISVSKKYTVHISSIPTAWTARAQSTVLLNNVQPLVGNTWGNYKKWSISNFLEYPTAVSHAGPLIIRLLQLDRLGHDHKVHPLRGIANSKKYQIILAW